MNGRTKFTIQPKYILFILSIVCAGLIVVSLLLPSVGTKVKNAAAYVIVPLQEGVNTVGSWMSDRADMLKDIDELTAENESLNNRIDELASENTQLAQEKYELERLRELYELDEEYSEYDKVAAKVIGKDTGNWFNIFTINKGSDDGIEKDMNVISGGGLVGIISSVGKNYATVRAIIDDESSVSVQFVDTSDTGIVSGDLTLIENNLLNVTDIIKDADIKDGAMVVTSNISAKFLPGILVGYVTELSPNSDNLTQSGYVIPAVDFAHIEEVLVITKLKQTADEVEE